MGEAKRCNVVGFPINHSLSPHLFALVHEHLGFSWKMPRKISTSDINEMYDLREKPPLLTTEFEQIIKLVTNEINGENIDISEIPTIEIHEVIQEYNGEPQWGSITSPLKHQLGNNLVNCYVVDNERIRCAMTDGYGVVLVAKQFGIDFDTKPVLHVKGGGSSAIATVNAWLSMGGEVKALSGRRDLPDKLILKCTSELDANLCVDFDDSSDSEGLVLFPSYGSDLHVSQNKIDGRWMLIAQHLLAWAVLFAPEERKNLPSLDLLFKRLILLETLI